MSTTVGCNSLYELVSSLPLLVSSLQTFGSQLLSVSGACNCLCSNNVITQIIGIHTNFVDQVVALGAAPPVDPAVIAALAANRDSQIAAVLGSLGCQPHAKAWASPYAILLAKCQIPCPDAVSAGAINALISGYEQAVFSATNQVAVIQAAVADDVTKFAADVLAFFECWRQCYSGVGCQSEAVQAQLITNYNTILAGLPPPALTPDQLAWAVGEYEALSAFLQSYSNLIAGNPCEKCLGVPIPPP